ncbi:MAG: tetratricopeptide repeat protein [Woeseiaceae bacterium]|nr:tetratricopeptide repeat protein [Woeseiaceae bacterium]
MLSRSCTDTRGLAVLLVIMLVIGGCGGSTPVKSAGDARQTERSATGFANDAAELAIPPAVLTLYEQAAASMASGDFVDAELRFKEFLLQYSNYPGAYVNLAIIHAGNGDDDAASAAIDAALALQPNQPAALNQLGMLLRRNGKFLEAEAAYLKAVTVSPDYALAHYNLGVLNDLYLQRLDVAIQHFETYQSIVGEDEQVSKWITDLTRRLAANQRAANVVE